MAMAPIRKLAARSATRYHQFFFEQTVGFFIEFARAGVRTRGFERRARFSRDLPHSLVGLLVVIQTFAMFNQSSTSLLLDPPRTADCTGA